MFTNYSAFPTDQKNRSKKSEGFCTYGKSRSLKYIHACPSSTGTLYLLK